MDDPGAGWTEERHASFLNWLEDCFVRRMLGLRGPPSAASRLAAAAAAAAETSDTAGTDPGSGDASVARREARRRRQRGCDAPLDQATEVHICSLSLDGIVISDLLDIQFNLVSKHMNHINAGGLVQVVPQLGTTTPYVSDENERKEGEGGTLTSDAPTGAGRKRRKR